MGEAADDVPVVAGQVRVNPGGRRLLVRQRSLHRDIWETLQLNGQWVGQKFGVPDSWLRKWPVIAVLPPEGEPLSEALSRGEEQH